MPKVISEYIRNPTTPAEVVYEGKSKKQVMYNYTKAVLVEDLSPIELLD